MCRGLVISNDKTLLSVKEYFWPKEHKHLPILRFRRVGHVDEKDSVDSEKYQNDLYLASARSRHDHLKGSYSTADGDDRDKDRDKDKDRGDKASHTTSKARDADPKGKDTDTHIVDLRGKPEKSNASEGRDRGGGGGRRGG
eukprot:CAMPEP_0173127246 /NCGR_PEP_ID=MMETSP1102-20130122/57668_1 /TAXON_ID=49646 /ORGANISM="Geminigera sp., Strain Caron Lab Isolate" /LENGTH=140 /DNA_ID=CAMNT_0014036809 /DNA_START=668 /DNA_END=1087 /DNA_ORIENTATION=-